MATREPQFRSANAMGRATPACAPGGREDAGFTLVELMIAIGLMLIIMLQLNIIFNQSRQIFLAADAMVQVYQNARSALDLMERDIANMAKTSQMEFFADKEKDWGKGIYNPEEGETISGPSGVNPRFFEGVPYVYALSIRQNAKYTPKEAKEGGPYRRDGLYFRTVTAVDGKPAEALVRYDLYIGEQPENPLKRPILQRTLWEVDRVGAGGVPQVKKHDTMDVCYYVQDFQVELFLRDKRRRGVGRFYSAEEATVHPPTADAAPPRLFRYGAGDVFGVMCVSKNEQQAPGVLSTADATLTIADRQDRLPMLAAGDLMYVITRPDAGGQREDFGGMLRIKRITPDPNKGTIVEFDQSPIMIEKMANKRKNGTTTIECDWRAGWLPPALRITMKVKDWRSLEVRTIQRIFQILRT
jgi:prepilin-type N-terminal cleavage/methylation domain-containing protein